MNPVVRQLIRKDFHVMSGFVKLCIASALLSVLLVSLGGVAFAVGGILYITTSLGAGIFIAMICIMQERKDQSHLFASSLPVSSFQLTSAKLCAALVIYAVVWVLTTLLGLAATQVLPRLQDGQFVQVLVMQGFILALCCVFFGANLLARSESLAGAFIIAVNMAFTLFMIGVGQPAFARPLRTEQIVWTDAALLLLAAELVLIVLSLAATLYVLSRRREYT